MNIIEDVKPLSFFKQKTGDVIKHIKNTKKPTFITINGNVELVIQDAKSYQNMVDYISKMDDANKIINALNEIENGGQIPIEDVFERLKRKYNI